MGEIRRILIVGALLLSSLAGAQVRQRPEQVRIDTSRRTVVRLEQARTLSSDEATLPGAQVLVGSVRFRHDNAVMYCDSAHFYEKTNNFEAFGHIRMVQADTIVITGDRLYYDGNTRVATLWGSCRLSTRTSVLETDSMKYDRNLGLAYYYTGAVMTDRVNSMTSVWGQYEPRTGTALFREKVVIAGKTYTLVGDTVQYNTRTHVADLLSRSIIVYEEKTVIGGSRGWYNTTTGHSMLTRKPSVVHQDGQTLLGDTIYYDRRRDFGEVHGHMQLTDSTQHTTLFGNYGTYCQHEGNGMATDSAYAIEWSNPDTIYVHGDSLFLHRFYVQDSVNYRTDTFQLMRAYYNVRVYKSDLQAICDSMVLNTQDSVMYLRQQPIAWNQNNQLSGDSADVFLQNGFVDHAHLMGNALAIQEIDSIHYNQMHGNEMFGYVVDQELRRVDVNGNVETIYYPQETKRDSLGDSIRSLIGCNKTESSFLRMYLHDRKVERAIFTTATTGVMYPLDQITQEDQRLRNYFWAVSERPTCPEDIFGPTIHTKRSEAKASAVSKKPDKKETKAKTDTRTYKQDLDEKTTNNRAARRAERQRNH